MPTPKTILRRFTYILLMLTILYLGAGVGFHFLWHQALDACRESRAAQEEIVEPEVFGNGIGLLFDSLYWPVYVRANLFHFGTVFSTPCNHE